jgi:hypothetical protein
MKNWVMGVVASGLWLLPVPGQAQGKFPPASFSNLQVMPASSTPTDVVGTMKQFAQSLGVRCQFCHVGKEGLPLDQFDFVSDDVSQKRIARAMMRLVQGLNTQLAKELPQSTARVTCYTCHRGSAKPVHAP